MGENSECHIKMEVLTGLQANKYFTQIADIRINMFREFPYLYEGSYEYEQDYLKIYFESPNSRIILLFADDKVVGFSNSIPLSEELEEIKDAFIQNNLDVDQYLYIGEMMILREYQSKGWLRKWFQYHEQRAIKLGKPYITGMTVNRDSDHASKPEDYRALDSIWLRYGFRLIDGATIQLPWKQIDTQKEELNELSIWVKTLAVASS